MKTAMISFRASAKQKQRMKKIVQASGKNQSEILSSLLDEQLDLLEYQMHKIEQGKKDARERNFVSPKEVQKIFQKYQ